MAGLLFSVFLALVVLAVQPALGAIAPMGATPDLILALACAYAMRIETQGTISIGFGAGLLDGLMVGKSLGSFCASRTVAMVFAAWAKGVLLREGALSTGMICSGATWICELVFAVLSPRAGFFTWLETVALLAFFNAAAAMVLFEVIDLFESLSRRRRPVRHRVLQG
jgi:hypothetical protein